MSKAKVKAKQTTRIEHRGNIYTGSYKNGSVTVRLQRTAHGQELVVGTYNILEDTWTNEDRNGIVPPFVKEQIKKAFS